jgi:hypothetical protein
MLCSFPNSAQLEQICSIDVETAQLICWSLTTKQVPGRCYAGDVTVVSFCPDANAQVWAADAQILRQCWTTVPKMLRSCTSHVAQVPDIPTQLPRRSCAVVLKLLRRVTCAAELVNRCFNATHSSKLWSFNDAGPMVLYADVKVSWRCSVCDLILCSGFHDSAQVYRQCCTVLLTLLYTGPLASALFPSRQCEIAKMLLSMWTERAA